jgi:hypothetical protein
MLRDVRSEEQASKEISIRCQFLGFGVNSVHELHQLTSESFIQLIAYIFYFCSSSKLYHFRDEDLDS